MTRFIFLLSLPFFASAEDKLSVLIIDGRNNHDWRVTTDALRSTLQHSGRFEVSVSTAPESKTPRSLRLPNEGADEAKKLLEPLKRVSFEGWQPRFADFDVVLLNYNGPNWSQQMQADFVEYVRNGGGLVLVHAANNAFRDWAEFNEMIGLGWRPAAIGRCAKVNPQTGETELSLGGKNSGHGSKHAFQVTVRQPEHPIMRGMPSEWMHATDELYHNMRGTAKNLTILSSAYSDPKQRGTGEHEPITWEVGFGKGRVIVTSMGHFWPQQDWWDSLYCVGFQTILARSCEYAATGEVTLAIAEKFPGTSEVSIRKPSETWNSQTNVAAKLEKADPYAMISPEAQLATFQLADGYIADLVAAEPDVQEPVLTVWDGNGAMYVAEMLSYMQDEKGTGTKTLKNGRIKRLEDTDGDGRMDRVTVFVDGLNLPRAILPLDGRIAVRETDSTRVIAYRDTDGDGVADESETIFEGSTKGRNGPGKSVEHQDSGLIWNLDNWIYVSYNEERYRFTEGKWIAERQPSQWTQWGLDRDDIGRLFWSDNTHPLKAVQLHPKYWNVARKWMTKSFSGDPVDTGDPYDPGFMNAKSLCLLNDRGGSATEVRAFTSVCGQSVFRGHKLSFKDRGRYFCVDPTIHVLRRANIVDRAGKIMLEKAEPGDAEFLLSPDINCRFVNTATGPDGTLYVTDMYRGIIQDAGWLSPGPRQFIRESGLWDNNRHGRIWRIRHRDHEPGRLPGMLDESTVELVRHLEHPNGWWRDTAQKLIVLRDDRESVLPLLEATVRFNQNPLARLHALWTLEGIGAVNAEILNSAYVDRDWRVRRAGIQVAESMLPEKPGILADLSALSRDSHPEVAKQLIFTFGTVGSEEAIEVIQQAARKHRTHQGVMLATTVSLWGMKDLPLIAELDDPLWKTYLANWERGLDFPKNFPDQQRRAIQSGETLYFKTCVACHGSDGRGMKVPGSDLALAPSLVGSPRVQGDAKTLVPILLHGLMGPIDGKTYQAGFMAPAAALGITRDDRLAEVLSYIRYAWGQELPPISKEEVKDLRKEMSDRKTPWTQDELP